VKPELLEHPPQDWIEKSIHRVTKLCKHGMRLKGAALGAKAPGKCGYYRFC